MTDEKNNSNLQSNLSPFPGPSQLRQQAEQKARSMPLPDLDNMTHEEIRQMAHEMKVKQIEAELQIEHLRSGLEKNNDQASLFSIVTENMLDMVALTDMDGNFTFAGKSHEVLGYEPGFLIGKNVMDFVHPEDLPGILEEFAEFVTSGHPRKVEYRNRCKDDTYIWLETQGNFIKDENGVSQKIIFNSRDITERKRSEEKLRESEEKYRRITENISDVVWIMGLDMQLSYVSPSVEKMVGESVATHMNRTIEERHPPESTEKIYAFITEELEKENDPYVDKNRSREIEVEHYRADKTKFWVSVNASFLRDENDNPIGIQGVTRDITERKQEEEKLRKIYNNTHDAIIIHDRNGKIIDVNNRMCQIYNLSKEEAIACTIQDISSPDMSVQNLSKIWKKVLNDENQFFEWEAFSPNYRSIFYVEVSLAKIDHYNECFIIANIRDITQRKQQENALRQSENYYRTIFETSGSTMFIIEEDTTISHVNSNFEVLSGYSKQEVEGKKSWTEFVHPGDVEWMKENHYLRRCDPRAAFLNYEFRFFVRNGELRNGYLTIDMIPGTARSVVSLIDITERKRVEEALADELALQGIFSYVSRRFLSLIDLDDSINACLGEIGSFCRADRAYLFQFAPDGLTMNNTHEWCAPGITPEITNLRDLPLSTFPWWIKKLEAGEIIHIPDVSKMPPEARAEQKILEDQNIQSVVVVPFLLQNKLAGFLGFDAVNLRRTRGTMDVGPLQTITEIISTALERKRMEEERKKLHEQLSQAQKMESIGKLAGGVAHDFNNKLAIINGYAEMALDMIESLDPLHETIQEIHTAGQQSADIVRQLLAFARQQTVSPVLLDLNDTISSMLKMLQRLIGENIDLIWHPGSSLWPVKVDPSQVDQIMANLAVNARDAISDVGNLTIETKNTIVDEDYCKSNPEAFPGRYVMLAVSDDGQGIEKEVRERIFDPYFTTKEIGKGTGLGLPTIYGIVKQNNGFINVYSEPGQGTTFKLYFPSCETEKSSVTP